jgi:hypothetical protein
MVMSLAQKTIDNFAEKALRLYEQEPPHRRMKRLGEYTHRWRGWALSIATVAAPIIDLLVLRLLLQD